MVVDGGGGEVVYCGLIGEGMVDNDVVFVI